MPAGAQEQQQAQNQIGALMGQFQQANQYPGQQLGVLQSAIAFHREDVSLKENLAAAAQRSAAAARARLESADILLETLAWQDHSDLLRTRAALEKVTGAWRQLDRYIYN